MSKKKTNGRFEWIRTFFYAVAIALVIRTLAFEPFNIPSGSMRPTLLEGDYLFVSKYSYGYSRHSLPFSLPLISGRVFFHEPDRGDVAVFKQPLDNKTDYIKRIIGLPGDRIQVKGGRLYINGEAVIRQRIEDFLQPGLGNTVHRATQYIEILPNNRRHLILEETDNGSADDTRAFTVPAGFYFVMGDNRDNSNDSRIIGPVPKENLVGRAEILFFSVKGAGWKFWKWPSAIRYRRLFSAIN
jgi:signal peptidase I